MIDFLKELADAQIVKLINVLLMILSNRGTLVVDGENPEYRLVEIKPYTTEDDFFFELEEIE